MFCQTGCGPNLEGGIITLCTCRHDIRATWEKELSDWKNVWIGGITTTEAKGFSERLFYLMKVQDAYESCFDLWNAEFWKESHYDKDAKNATKNPLGDIYEPTGDKLKNEERFCPSKYIKPIENHEHAGKLKGNEQSCPSNCKVSIKNHAYENDPWKKDIDYKYKGKRRPVYLVGDPENSFIWLDPKKSPKFIKANWRRIRATKKIRFRELTTYLGD